MGGRVDFFQSAENEFVAEDDFIEIVPNVRMDTLHLICVFLTDFWKHQCLIGTEHLIMRQIFRRRSRADSKLHCLQGDYGPFVPQVPLCVPSWLGLALKKRGKCRLQAPEWMGTETLAQAVEAEKESPVEFQPLPFHYIEMGRLVTVNEEEMPGNPFSIRKSIEDVRDVRRDKIDTGFPKLLGRTHAVKMRNLSAMEVNQIRPFSMMSLSSYYKLDSEDLITQSGDDSQMFPI